MIRLFLIGPLSADEKELAAYKLTMATLKKVLAATREMTEIGSQDARQQQTSKLDAEIESVEAELEKLQAKDELTKAEQGRVDALNQQLEKLQDRKAEAEATLSAENRSSNPRHLLKWNRTFGRSHE